MWHPPAITGDNLRLIVREAPKGAEIELPLGEFRGPFILDQPIRLVGQGEQPGQTTLWVQRGPAIIVRSPGVTLANINVELTLPEARQSDALIWYAPGCKPASQGALLQGQVKQMAQGQSGGGWNLPNLIDLGDIRAKHSLTLPMVIQIPGPATLKANLTNLAVAPKRLSTGGEHLIRVGIQPGKLFKDTMLAGQLVIDSGGDSRAIWIIGRVLEDKQLSLLDKIILVAKSGRRFGFDPGMLLGKAQLQGEPGADRLPDKQAFIFKESSGVWSIFQPQPLKQTTEVNGKPLDVGRRLPLKGGEVIKIGGVELTVDASKTDLPISADGSVDFGKLSARGSASPPVLHVKNNYKRKKWEGTLRSTVPWIQVPQSQVVVPGGQTVDVPLQWGSGFGALPQEASTHTGALVLEGSKESWVISAQVEVDVKEGLEATPTTLDFGRLSDPSAAAAQTLSLRNTGTTDWQGSVKLAVPWLQVDQTSLSLKPGGKASLQVSLTAQVASLKDGPHSAASAITIEGQGLSAQVSARLHYAKPKVKIDIQPPSLDWGEVTNWQAARSHTIQVENTGDKDWQGRVSAKVPWLKVEPATLSCPARGRTSFTVSLTEHYRDLSEGEHKEAAAVHIQGQGFSSSIQVRIESKTPELEIHPAVLNIILHPLSSLPRDILHIRNPGSQAWRGSVFSNLRWLEVTPTKIDCAPGKEVEIQVSVNQEAKKVFTRRRTLTITDAIHVEGAGQPLVLGVSLDVRSKSDPQPTEKAVKQPVTPPVKPTPPVKREKAPSPPGKLAADFGVVNPLELPLPSVQIPVKNTQPQAMEGTIKSSLVWLGVTPTTFRCEPGKEFDITIQLNKHAVRMKERAYDFDDAIVIQCGDKTINVSVQVELSKAAVTPPPPPPPTIEKKKKPTPPPPPRTDIDFGTVSTWSPPLPSQTITITNSQVQAMKGSVSSDLPWITVSPSTFNCPPGQSIDITATLTKRASTLRAKPYDVSDGIIIKSGAKTTPIRVRLVVSKTTSSTGHMRAVSPPPPPPPSPLPLIDFGRITRWPKTLPSKQVSISNPEAKAIKGTVESTLPWLKVTPATFKCPPGQDVTITVQLTDQATKLRAKTYTVKDAIKLKHGTKTILIEANMVVATSPKPVVRTIKGPAPKPKPKPKSGPKPEPKLPEALVVEPTSLNMGTVSSWRGALPEHELEITNGLKTDWKGTIKVSVPWLEVSPSELECPSGGTISVKVRLTQHGSGLRSRTYTAPGGLLIEGGGQKIEVKVSMTVR